MKVDGLTPRMIAALVRLSKDYRRERDRDYIACGFIAHGIETWHRLHYADPYTGGLPNRFLVEGWNARPTADALVARGLAEKSSGFWLDGALAYQTNYRVTDAGVRWLAEHGIRDYKDVPPPDYKSRGGIPGVEAFEDSKR